MDTLELKETVDGLATANGVRWYGHVRRSDDNSVLRVALDFEVSGKKKQGQPKKKQVEEETKKIGLKDALNQAVRWITNNCGRNGVNLAISAKGKISDKKIYYIYYIFADLSLCNGVNFYLCEVQLHIV